MSFRIGIPAFKGLKRLGFILFAIIKQVLFRASVDNAAVVIRNNSGALMNDLLSIYWVDRKLPLTCNPAFYRLR